MKTAIIAAILSLSTLACPGTLSAQDPVDWPALVDKAHHHRRYAMRRALANKIAQAGAVAMPALTAFATKNGSNAVDVLVVEAMANASSTDAPVIEVLTGWAKDRDFYWRAQAMRGLANRGSSAHRKLFASAAQDPSHLMRVQGTRGLLALGEPREAIIKIGNSENADPDPRAQIRIAKALALHSEEHWPKAIPALIAGLAYRDLEFSGDPWGAREAQLVVKTCRKLVREKHKVDPESFGWQDPAELDALCAWASAVAGHELKAPAPIATMPGIRGGLEFRSCRNGDLFVQWDKEAVYIGLSSPLRIPLQAEDRSTPPPRADTKRSLVGKVVCDFVRLKSEEDSFKAAPAALPPAPATWIEGLAAALVRSGNERQAYFLRQRLRQFAP